MRILNLEALYCFLAIHAEAAAINRQVRYACDDYGVIEGNVADEFYVYIRRDGSEELRLSRHRH